MSIKAIDATATQYAKTVKKIVAKKPELIIGVPDEFIKKNGKISKKKIVSFMTEKTDCCDKNGKLTPQTRCEIANKAGFDMNLSDFVESELQNEALNIKKAINEKMRSIFTFKMN